MKVQRFQILHSSSRQVEESIMRREELFQITAKRLLVIRKAGIHIYSGTITWFFLHAIFRTGFSGKTYRLPSIVRLIKILLILARDYHVTEVRIAF